MRPSSLAAVLLLISSALAADTPVLRQTISLPANVTISHTAVSPTGKLVAAACGDSKVRLWDVESGSLKSTLDLNGERPTIIQFSLGGEFLAAGGEGGTVRVWDASGALLHEYKVPAEVDSLALAPDLATIAIAPLERPIEVRSVVDGKLLASFPATFSGSAAVAYSPDGRWLASTDADTEIRIIDALSLTLHARLTDFLLEQFAIAFSSDSAHVITGGANGIVSLIDANSGKIAKAFPKRPAVIFGLCAAPDGRSITSVYVNADDLTAPVRVFIWDTSSGSLRRTIPAADSGFNGGNYTLSNTLLLTSGSEKELKIWADH